jgi:putative ABC transport system permease protein
MRDPSPPTTIIGVVRDIKHSSLESKVRPSVYWPYPELAMSMMTFVVRTQGNPLDLVPSVRQVIHTMDPEQPIADIRPMKDLLGNSMIHAEFNTILMACLASVALTLAMVGIYSVMSYSVLQRVQELGVRMALGANSYDVLRLVLKQGGMLVILGTTIGLAAAAGLTRWMKSLLFEVSTTDAFTFGFVTLLLIGVALIACWIPARRAAKLDPMIALRAE